MASKSTIEWTQATWNPVRGCSRISEGCRFCYAERMAARGLPGMCHPYAGDHFAIMTPSGPHWTGRVELIPHMLDVPLKRRKPTTFFVNSMSDLFHENLPDEAIDRVFAVMALCPQHTFQVLTKRAKRMREYFANDPFPRITLAGSEMKGLCGTEIPMPNVHLGVSVEDQQRADERIPDLLATPAAVRFLSVEPLLGRVDLENIPVSRDLSLAALSGSILGPMGALKHNRIDWVIVGGESGPGARPMHPDWARNTRDQCVAVGVPFFFKQWGAYYPLTRTDGIHELPFGDYVPETRFGFIKRGKKAAGRLLDGREWNEVPQAVRP